MVVFGVRLVLRVGRLEFVLLVGHRSHYVLAEVAGYFLIRRRAYVAVRLMVLLLQLNGSGMGRPRGPSLSMAAKLRWHTHVLAVLLLLEVVVLVEERFAHT